MKNKNPKKRKKRIFLKICLFLILAIIISCFFGCCTPEVLQQVENPRDGKIIRDKYAVIYSYNYSISLYGLEKLHPFDIRKYEEIYMALVEDGSIQPQDVFVPSPLTDEDILLVHSEEFLESLNDSAKLAEYLEAPQTTMLPASVIRDKMVLPFRLASGGTLLAAREALKCDGVGINIGGGYHHAKPEHGEGFCIFADIPIAIRKLQKEGKIKTAMVFDLDVHQGNGTAVCLADDNTTFTFSMHKGDIYPIPKEKSDMDIELMAGEGDREILPKVKAYLEIALDKFHPDILFYVAGCDMLNGDPLASIAMTEEGIVKRDALVITACKKRNIPVVMVLAGGYSPNAWRAQYKSIKNILQIK